MGLLSLLFSNPMAFALLAGVLLYSVIAHEIAHGWVAYFFGDTSAKYAGRLTLDPRSHLDPMGTIALLLVGFGWARPVPVNYNNLRNFRVGLFCVALAGVFTNILIATVALLVLRVQGVNPDSILGSTLWLLARINIVLGAFNLIPIPPLDGSKILMAFLSTEQQYRFARFESYGFIILIVLLFTGLLDPAIGFIQGLILSLIGLIVR